MEDGDGRTERGLRSSYCTSIVHLRTVDIDSATLDYRTPSLPFYITVLSDGRDSCGNEGAGGDGDQNGDGIEARQRSKVLSNDGKCESVRRIPHGRLPYTLPEFKYINPKLSVPHVTTEGWINMYECVCVCLLTLQIYHRFPFFNRVAPGKTECYSCRRTEGNLWEV